MALGGAGGRSGRAGGLGQARVGMTLEPLLHIGRDVHVSWHASSELSGGSGAGPTGAPRSSETPTPLGTP